MNPIIEAMPTVLVALVAPMLLTLLIVGLGTSILIGYIRDRRQERSIRKAVRDVTGGIDPSKTKTLDEPWTRTLFNRALNTLDKQPYNHVVNAMIGILRAARDAVCGSEMEIVIPWGDLDLEPETEKWETELGTLARVQEIMDRRRKAVEDIEDAVWSEPEPEPRQKQSPMFEGYARLGRRTWL